MAKVPYLYQKLIALGKKCKDIDRGWAIDKREFSQTVSRKFRITSEDFKKVITELDEMAEAKRDKRRIRLLRP